jgi:hypothetical protein
MREAGRGIKKAALPHASSLPNTARRAASTVTSITLLSSNRPVFTKCVR